MNRIFIIFLLILFSLDAHTFAARVLLDVPTTAATNGEPFAVTISLDGEGQVLSSVKGELSFSSQLFEIQDIITRGSIVPLWVIQPKQSNSYEESGRTIISFAGIMPGGFDGVRSPYYSGVKPGEVLIVTLLPKKKGTDTVLLDKTELHLFDNKGTTIPTTSVSSIISVPDQSIAYNPITRPFTLGESYTLVAHVDRDPLIMNNAWYLSVTEDESVRPIKKIYAVETSEYDPQALKDSDWQEVENTHKLIDQSRSKYIQIKVLYEDNVYVLRTIAPVENSHTISRYLSILVIITITCLVLYLYATKRNRSTNKRNIFHAKK